MGTKVKIAVPLLCLFFIHCLAVQDKWSDTGPFLFLTGFLGAFIALFMYVIAGQQIMWLLGFTPAGITPRTTGARLMAWVYTYGIGHSVLSAMQSAGTGGIPSISAVIIMLYVGWLAGLLLGLVIIICIINH